MNAQISKLVAQKQCSTTIRDVTHCSAVLVGLIDLMLQLILLRCANPKSAEIHFINKSSDGRYSARMEVYEA